MAPSDQGLADRGVETADYVCAVESKVEAVRLELMIVQPLELMIVSG